MNPQDRPENRVLNEALLAYEDVTATAATVIQTQLDVGGEQADAEI